MLFEIVKKGNNQTEAVKWGPPMADPTLELLLNYVEITEWQ